MALEAPVIQCPKCSRKATVIHVTLGDGEADANPIFCPFCGEHGMKWWGEVDLTAGTQTIDKPNNPERKSSSNGHDPTLN